MNIILIQNSYTEKKNTIKLRFTFGCILGAIKAHIWIDLGLFSQNNRKGRRVELKNPSGSNSTLPIDSYTPAPKNESQIKMVLI